MLGDQAGWRRRSTADSFRVSPLLDLVKSSDVPAFLRRGFVGILGAAPPGTLGLRQARARDADHFAGSSRLAAKIVGRKHPGVPAFALVNSCVTSWGI